MQSTPPRYNQQMVAAEVRYVAMSSSALCHGRGRRKTFDPRAPGHQYIIEEFSNQPLTPHPPPHPPRRQNKIAADANACADIILVSQQYVQL